MLQDNELFARSAAVEEGAHIARDPADFSSLVSKHKTLILQRGKKQV